MKCQFVDILLDQFLSGEIYRQVRRAIVDRRLQPGERLPPSRELAPELVVARRE